jgi:hypothetical protein
MAGSSLFAVGVAELSKPLNVSSAFHSADLKHLRVSVYRAQNGKKITAVTISDPLPTVQTFALSPDGRHVAILQNEQIVLYALPEPAERDFLIAPDLGVTDLSARWQQKPIVCGLRAANPSDWRRSSRPMDAKCRTYAVRIWETGFSCSRSSVACTRRSE